MKQILFFLSISLFTALSLNASESWTEDFEAAQKKAKAENKPMMLEFTGSDWCPPCMALHKNVFSQSAFKKYADESLVWVRLDFPRSQSQSSELKKQNNDLAESYGIRGFPTILLVEPDGELIAQTGFRRLSPEGYAAHLQELLAEGR
jgi:thioredoxin-related protein